MSVREFVDTNIFVYSHDVSAGIKREKTIELLDRQWSSGGGCISIQVLQEFYVSTTAKLGLASDEAEAQIERLSKWKVHAPTHSDVLSAIALHRERRISFWDAMIVNSASRLDCVLLWTEDLSSGEVIDGVEIRNPFLA